MVGVVDLCKLYVYVFYVWFGKVGLHVCLELKPVHTISKNGFFLLRIMQVCNFCITSPYQCKLCECADKDVCMCVQ